MIGSVLRYWWNRKRGKTNNQNGLNICKNPTQRLLLFHATKVQIKITITAYNDELDKKRSFEGHWCKNIKELRFEFQRYNNKLRDKQKILFYRKTLNKIKLLLWERGEKKGGKRQIFAVARGDHLP